MGIFEKWTLILFSHFRTFETSWNDRYLMEPIGPTLGRTNIITEESDKIHKSDIYKQQSSETTFNSFLGNTKEVTQSYSSSGQSTYGDQRKDSRMLDSIKSSSNGQPESYDYSRRSSSRQMMDENMDSRKSSKWMTNGQKMDDRMDSRKSSANSSRKSDNDSNYYSKSSSYSSSYQKTSINGQDQESSSYNEHHYDSRDGDSYNKGINNFNQDFGSSSRKSSLAANGSTTEMERRLERQRRESTRKSSG